MFKVLLASFPVELLDFQATLQGKTISISWLTATEDNNHGFTIQRSLDGLNFSDIGFVTGAGTSL